MNIQNDVDEPLNPLPEENTYFKMAFQNPVILYYGSDKMVLGNDDAKSMSYGDINFNYENAITSFPEGEISIAASDFDLQVFAGNEKFYLKTVFAGNEMKYPLESLKFSQDFSSVDARLPKKLDPIAYKLCLKEKKNEKTD